VKELELESVPLHDDPLPLFRAIAALARQVETDRSDHDDTNVVSGDRQRAEAHERVSRALAGRPMRRFVFSQVLEHARRRVRDRENLRLERTRLFARVRQIFLELGRRLHDMDQLDDARDVLYLEIDEVLAFVDGRSTCTDLRGLAALRRREFGAYESGSAPDSRFESHGSPYHGCDHRRANAPVPESGDERRGLGCSPGVVRGPVRIVTDPRTADLSDRPIVVARHTDPGWILVFPSALGVLVERGSLLSHAAIVARELGVPAVVSLPGVVGWLRDGDWVEMDGGAGTVRRIGRAGEQDRAATPAGRPVVAANADVKGAVVHA
jgi:pyruvate,water dikinase